MKLLGEHAYLGGSRHGPYPATQLRLQITAEDNATQGIDRLWKWIAPRLEQHQARLPEDTPETPAPDASDLDLGGAIGALALGLLDLVGAPLSRARFTSVRGPGDQEVIVHFESLSRATGSIAGQTAIRLLQACLAVDDQAPAPPRLDQAVDEAIERFVHLATPYTPDPLCGALAEAARAAGLPAFFVDAFAPVLQIGYGSGHLRFAGRSENRTPEVGDFIDDRAFRQRLLGRALMPCVAHHTVSSEKDALATLGASNTERVVKPARGSLAGRYTVGVRHPAAMSRAFQRAQGGAPEAKVLIERALPGKHYRLLVAKGRFVAAVQIRPASVVGDGQRTIQQLIDRENARPERSKRDRTPLYPIPVDEGTEAILRRQGLALDSIPKAEQRIRLRDEGSWLEGATIEDVTHKVHPDHASLAIQAAAVLDLEVAEVDLVFSDIEQSWRGSESDEVITDVRGDQVPGTDWNHPDVVDSVAKRLLESLETPELSRPFPLVAVTGTNGKTTTCRMVSAILRQAGHQVGRCETGGIRVGEHVLSDQDASGFAGARTLLCHPHTDAAVLETARGGLLRRGMGFEHCDVAALTNVTEDHLGQYGIETLEDMTRLKEVVVQSATKRVVLSADDEHAFSVRDRLPGREICLVSADPQHPALLAHRESGGPIACFSGEGADSQLRWIEKQQTVLELKAGEIPSTHGGTARTNFYNALFAGSLAFGLDLPAATIAEGLRAFHPDFADNPGRLNLIQRDPYHILIDISPNPDAMRELVRYVDTLAIEGRRLISFAQVSNRQQEHTRNTLAEAAGHFDRYVCGNFPDLRGASPELVPHRNRDILSELGVPEDQIALYYETDGLGWQQLIRMANPGDLVVITRPLPPPNFAHQILAYAESLNP